jgi:FkbM family methyltransferase
MNSVIQLPVGTVVQIAGGFLVPPCDLIGGWQVESGRLDHDRWVLEKIRPHFHENDVVIDVGALNGDHTIAYSQWVGPGGTVVAFEPGEVAYRCLAHNIQLFPHKNVQAHQAALGRVNDVCEHVVNHENLGGSVVKTGVGKIPMITLDAFCFGFSRLNFIKIDAEGMEADILDGGRITILKHLPILMLEVRPAVVPYEILATKLFDLGYTPRVLQDCPTDSPQFDIICFP